MANTTTKVEIGYAPSVTREFTTNSSAKVVNDFPIPDGDVRTYRITAQANEQGTNNPNGGAAQLYVTVRHSAASTAVILGTTTIFSLFSMSAALTVAIVSGNRLQTSVQSADGGNFDWVIVFEQLLTSSV